jgi:hypothetical protein
VENLNNRTVKTNSSSFMIKLEGNEYFLSA